MNVAENQDKPVEEGAFVLDLNDIAEAEKEEESLDTTVEDTTEPQTEEVDTPVETKEGETDYTSLLERLSKDIKFMDNEVKIGSIDEGKALIQKGLNHDRLEKKLQDLESNKGLTYIRNKAKELGMTEDQYVDAVEKYERDNLEQQEIAKLVDEGVNEETAKRMIEAERKAANAERLVNELTKDKTEQAKKDAEYDEFVKEFPDVDIKKIPSEVIEESKKTSLTNAYTKYLYKEALKENATLKQNKENSQKAPVNGVSEHGGVVVDNDPFLKGFGVK